MFEPAWERAVSLFVCESDLNRTGEFKRQTQGLMDVFSKDVAKFEAYPAYH